MQREMQALNALLEQQQQQQQQVMSLQDLQNQQMPFETTSSSSTHDDFLEQILSSINPSSWPDLPQQSSASAGEDHRDNNSGGGCGIQPQQLPHPHQQYHHFDDQHHNHHPPPSPALLASKLRHHQINPAAAAAKALMLQQHLLLARGLRSSPTPSGAGGETNGLLPMPLNLGNADQTDVVDHGNDNSVQQSLFNGFGGSLGQTAGQTPHFHHQPPNFGATVTPSLNQSAPPSGSTGTGGGTGTPAQPRQQRVRARRGQATDPHSIAERLRRERIAERMKALQELVPNANKTDKASMLDEIIDYVKFLQLQVKVLSMSRLGGAAAVAPLVADMNSEGAGDGGRAAGNQTASSSNHNDTITMTEHQVAKLMEEDMGSAMQYLQGKGLCLMPISLATAISTATCHSRSNPGGPSSPSMSSVLTVQSAATLANGAPDPSVKDAASVSKS